MEEASRRGILGQYWSFDERRINILLNKIECNYSSRNTSSPLYFKSWKIETGEMLNERRFFVSSTTTKILIETRSQFGLKGMINRVLQLNNSQLKSSFNSLLEKHLVLNLPKPTQSKPNPICDRTGKPMETERVFVEKEKTSHSQEIVGKRLQEELGSSDRTGKPLESSTNTHTVQDFGSPEHRDTASSNANKFNLAIDEENIDFNISGVPNAMVKRSHGINVHNLIQQIENHFQRQALQSDLQQHRAFNLFSEESKDAITAAGNTELCEIVDVEPKSQCRYNRKQEVHLVRVGSLLYPELLHQERSATRSQVREERRLQRIPHGKTTSKEVSKETIRKQSWSIYPRHDVQEDDDWVGSLWRSHPWNGQTCKRRPQSYCHRKRNWCISW